MFPITITVSSMQELDAVRAVLYKEGKNPPAVAPVTSKATPPATPAAQTAPAGASDKPASTPPARDFTIDQAKALTIKGVNAGKKVEIEGLLAKFNAAIPEGKKIRTAAGLPAANVAPYCEAVLALGVAL